MVACKTIGEYKGNQEEKRKFCLEEAKQLKAATNSQPIVETKLQKPKTRNLRTGKKVSKWSPDKVRKVSSQNQKHQRRKKTPTTPKETNQVVGK